MFGVSAIAMSSRFSHRFVVNTLLELVGKLSPSLHCQ